MDETTRAMLLRQVYVAAMERRRYGEARSVAEQMIEVAVLADVAYQDAARACLGQGELESAVCHLRMAARSGPASRRAFHLSMLGALLYLNGRTESAIMALEIAARWSTTDKAICRTQLALARHALGEGERSVWQRLRCDLESAAHHRGYAEYLLGELCLLLEDESSAVSYFQSFVERTTTGRVALAVGLRAEIRAAKRHLAQARRHSTG